MATTGFTWQPDILNIVRATDAYTRAIQGMNARTAQELARWGEQHMKRGHRWQNRTGRAERGLFGAVEVYPTRARVVLGQRYADRAILEYMQAGTYAIIRPTLLLVRDRWRRQLRAHGFRT